MSDRLLKESDVLRAVDERIEDLSKSPVFLRKNGRIDVLGIKNYILAIPSADKWIPCSERLPSENDYIGDLVIWCTDRSIVGVGWYYESTESWATIDDTFSPILGEVVAWMPLPEPYKGEDDGSC